MQIIPGNLMRRLCFILTLMLCCGCSVFTQKKRADPPVSVPQQYVKTIQSEKTPDKWWEAFGSPELNRMVQTALGGNFDLKTAWARLKQSRAVTKQTRADAYPGFEAEAKANQERRYDHSEHLSTSDTFSMNLAASYELDLWGKIASDRKAARLSEQAAWEDVQTSALTVAAEVVSTWIDLRATVEEIRLVKKQIAINSKYLEMQRSRFLSGQATALDVSQQEETLASSRAKLPSLQTEQQTLRNQMAVLLGKAPDGDIRVQNKGLPQLIPVPDTGVPMDLLSSRPDIRAARLELFSADWEVAAARADWLPSITLSASGVLSGQTLDAVLSNWYTTLSASLAQTLFDAGRRSAVVEQKKAQAEEKLYAYGQTVIQAIQDVQDALANEAGQKELISKTEDQLQAAESAMQKAELRYLNGQVDYLTYLNQLENVQSLNRQLIQQKAVLLKYRAGLYRNLGADWTASLKSNKATALQYNDKTGSKPNGNSDDR